MKNISGSEIIFYQLFEAASSTYTYLIADSVTKEAAIIDPVIEMIDRDLKLIEESGVKLKYILDTHIHADHITAAGELRIKTGAQTCISAVSQVPCVDILLKDGQELLLGDKKIKVMATPGHTNTCMSFYFEARVFTGDALLIRGCGRTDFQEGSSESLFKSVKEKIFTLPMDTLVFPAHDYKGQTSSTVGMERQHNPRLGDFQTLENFKEVMANLKLTIPAKIHEALPANMACGRVQKI